MGSHKYASEAITIRNANGRWVVLEIFGTERRKKAYALVSNLSNCMYPALQTHEFQFKSKKGTVYARYLEGKYCEKDTRILRS